MILLLALGMPHGGERSLRSSAGDRNADTITSLAAPGGNYQSKEQMREHRFWDKENDWLFAGVGRGTAPFDYFSTLNLRRRGDQEILVTNDLVDNHAAFAVVEAVGTRCFDWGVVFIPSLRPSQTGTLDFDRAFRVGDVGRSAQLLP